MCTQMLIYAIARGWCGGSGVVGGGGGGGGTDTVGETALKVGSGRKKKHTPLPHRGIEPASEACWSDTLPTKLHSHR